MANSPWDVFTKYDDDDYTIRTDVVEHKDKKYMKAKVKKKKKRVVSEETRKKISEGVKEAHKKKRYKKSIENGVKTFLEAKHPDYLPEEVLFDSHTLILVYKIMGGMELKFMKKLSKMFGTSKITFNPTSVTRCFWDNNTLSSEIGIHIKGFDEKMMEMFASLEEL